jgi:carbamoyl-phosphate synthase small subunit
MFTDFVNECGASKGGVSSMIADEVKVDGHAAKAAATA